MVKNILNSKGSGNKDINMLSYEKKKITGKRKLI